MKLAIIGSGISGLVAAHILNRRHDIVVYESSDRIGGHTHTVDVEIDGECHAIDTGFIVYNEKTYPRFSRLLEQLGVETQASDMSFGFACERTGIEWGSRGLRGVFAQPRNLLRPSFRRMLRDVLRFNRQARALLESGDEKVTLCDYLGGAGYSEEFLNHYVIPMGAAVWSADPASFLRIPAATFVRFFDNHGLLETNPSLPWRVVTGGSARYLDRLTEHFRGRIRADCPVVSVKRSRDYVEVISRDGGERFDRVVIATHSDQALRILENPTPAERQVLGAISYQVNDVTLHTDESLLPRSRSARASWNYRAPHSPGRRVLVTYDMNRLQGIASKRRFLVTLNGSDLIAPEHVLGRYRYDHPVLDGAAIAAQRLHREISGRNRTHYCGAYWGYGFHEDGVNSAIAACSGIAEGG